MLGFDVWFCLFVAVCSAVTAVHVCAYALHVYYAYAAHICYVCGANLQKGLGQ